MGLRPPVFETGLYTIPASRRELGEYHTMMNSDLPSKTWRESENLIFTQRPTKRRLSINLQT